MCLYIEEEEFSDICIYHLFPALGTIEYAIKVWALISCSSKILTFKNKFFKKKKKKLYYNILYYNFYKIVYNLPICNLIIKLHSSKPMPVNILIIVYKNMILNINYSETET